MKFGSSFSKLFVIGFAFLSTAYTFAASKAPIIIDFDSSKGSINHSVVSSDGKTIAFIGNTRVLLYKLDKNNAVTQINTDDINNNILNSGSIPTNYCDSSSFCYPFSLSADGKIFSFVTSADKNSSLYLYAINKDNTISPIDIPNSDFSDVTKVNKLSISDNGKVVLAETDKGMRLYSVNLETKTVNSIAFPDNLIPTSSIFAISATGQYLAVGSPGSIVYIAKITDLTSHADVNNMTRLNANFTSLNVSNDGATTSINDLNSGVLEVLGCCVTAKPQDRPETFSLPKTEDESVLKSKTRADLSDDGTFIFSRTNGLFKIQGMEATPIQFPSNDLVFYTFSRNHKTFVFERESEYNLYRLNDDGSFTQLNSTPITDDASPALPSLSGDGNTFVTLKGSTFQMNQALIYTVNTDTKLKTKKSKMTPKHK